LAEHLRPKYVAIEPRRAFDIRDNQCHRHNELEARFNRCGHGVHPLTKSQYSQHPMRSATVAKPLATRRRPQASAKPRLVQPPIPGLKGMPSGKVSIFAMTRSPLEHSDLWRRSVGSPQVRNGIMVRHALHGRELSARRRMQVQPGAVSSYDLLRFANPNLS